MIFNNYCQKALLNKLAWRLRRVILLYFNCWVLTQPARGLFVLWLLLLHHIIIATVSLSSVTTFAALNSAWIHSLLLCLYSTIILIYCFRHFQKRKVEKQAYWRPKCKGWLKDWIIARHDTLKKAISISWFMWFTEKNYLDSCGLNSGFFVCRSTLIKTGMSWNSILTGLESESSASAIASGSSMKVSNLLNVTLSTVISWWIYQCETFLILSPYTLFSYNVYLDLFV